MNKFQARLHRRLPPNALEFFTRRGNGCLIRCNFCVAAGEGGYPPDHLIYSYEKLWWLSGHIVTEHTGKGKPMSPPKIGAVHGGERSLEANRKPPRGNGAERSERYVV